MHICAVCFGDLVQTTGRRGREGQTEVRCLQCGSRWYTMTAETLDELARAREKFREAVRARQAER